MYYEVTGGASHKDAGLEHNPFIALVAPRPIGWISTLSRDGRPNLAPYSFFNALAARPPIVMFSSNGLHTDGGAKDSLTNARETGEFVHSMATWDLRSKVNQTSAPAPRGTDEFEATGLTRAACRVVKAPRVLESPVSLECKVLQVVDLPADDAAHPNAMVIGRVVAVHIRDDIVVGGRVDLSRARPLARLGYQDYCAVGELFEMRRPSWPLPRT